MIITYPTGLANAWFDRNPVDAMQAYVGAAIAPHALTQRWTYTIPVGRRGVIQHIFVETLRFTVAAPSGSFGAYIIANGGGTIHYLAYIDALNNTLGAQYVQSVPGPIFIPTGWVISAHTFDLSTGGSIDYTLSAAILTFG